MRENPIQQNRWPVERTDAERTADAMNVYRDLTTSRNYGKTERTVRRGGAE